MMVLVVVCLAGGLLVAVAYEAMTIICDYQQKDRQARDADEMRRASGRLP